jgi:hypothetical protein
MNLVVNLDGTELTPQISADGHQDAAPAPSLAPLPPPPTLFSMAGNKQIPNLRLGRAPSLVLLDSQKRRWSRAVGHLPNMLHTP